MLAVAGAGKTYHICNSIKPNKKNLILAYTHENVGNINKELIDAHGSIPELTSVMTFDSFVYRLLVRPYEPSIFRHFGQDDYKTSGITLTDPPPSSIQVKKGVFRHNPNYSKKGTLGHYVNRRGYYFNSKTSELIMEIKEKKDSLIKKAALALNAFFDQIFIDEFQDFRQYDFDLIVALSKTLDNVLLVGDYYQHSVSAINNSGKPFVVGKSKDIVNYSDFVESLVKLGFDVDNTTLIKSRRCPSAICEFVTTNLGINIEADNPHSGSVIWLESDAQSIIDDDSITKLVVKESDKYSFTSQNWSYSKGNTFSNACVVLTDNFETLASKGFKLNTIAPSTINKLYVAMTRTKGNLYIIKYSTFQGLKKTYLKAT